MPISARCKQNDEKPVKQELEWRSTLENRNWSDRSSRSTTTTPLNITTDTCSTSALLLSNDQIASNPRVNISAVPTVDSTTIY